MTGLERWKSDFDPRSDVLIDKHGIREPEALKAVEDVRLDASAKALALQHPGAGVRK